MRRFMLVVIFKVMLKIFLDMFSSLLTDNVITNSVTNHPNISELYFIKPWANGISSKRNLSLLATAFGVTVRAFKLACNDLRSLRLRSRSRSNRHPSRRNFFTVRLPDPSKFSDVHSLLKQPVNQLNTAYLCLFFATCMYL